MPKFELPETINIPYDSLSTEQRLAIKVLMNGDGLLNPITKKIKESNEINDNEISLIEQIDLSEVPLSAQQINDIVYLLNKLKLTLETLGEHTDKISGKSKDVLTDFFERLSIAGNYTKIMKSITGSDIEKYSFVFGSIMGQGDICLDKIKKPMSCDESSRSYVCDNIAAGSGILGLAQQIQNNPPIANSVINCFLPTIIECVENLVIDDELNYCEAKQVSEGYSAGTRIIEDTNINPFHNEIIKQISASEELKDSLLLLEKERLVLDEATRETSEFFKDFPKIALPATEAEGGCRTDCCESELIQKSVYGDCQGGEETTIGGPTGPPGLGGIHGPMGHIGPHGPSGICDCDEPPLLGACCINGYCLLSSEDQCTQWEGEYWGDESVCDFIYCGVCAEDFHCDCGDCTDNLGNPICQICCGGVCSCPCDDGGCPPCPPCNDGEYQCQDECCPVGYCCIDCEEFSTDCGCVAPCTSTGSCPDCVINGFLSCCPIGEICCGGSGCCAAGHCCGGTKCCTPEYGICCGETNCCSHSSSSPCCMDGQCVEKCPGPDGTCPDPNELCGDGCGCPTNEKCCGGECCEDINEPCCEYNNSGSGCPCKDGEVCCQEGCCEEGEVCCDGICADPTDLECCEEYAGGIICEGGNNTECCGGEGSDNVDKPYCCHGIFNTPFCCGNGCCDLYCGGEVCEESIADNTCNSCGQGGSYCGSCWADKDKWLYPGSLEYKEGCACGCPTNEQQCVYDAGGAYDGMFFCCPDTEECCPGQSSDHLCCPEDWNCCNSPKENDDGTESRHCCPEDSCCCWSKESGRWNGACCIDSDQVCCVDEDGNGSCAARDSCNDGACESALECTTRCNNLESNTTECCSLEEDCTECGCNNRIENQYFQCCTIDDEILGVLRLGCDYGCCPFQDLESGGIVCKESKAPAGAGTCAIGDDDRTCANCPCPCECQCAGANSMESNGSGCKTRCATGYEEGCCGGCSETSGGIGDLCDVCQDELACEPTNTCDYTTGGSGWHVVDCIPECVYNSQHICLEPFCSDICGECDGGDGECCLRSWELVDDCLSCFKRCQQDGLVHCCEADLTWCGKIEDFGKCEFGECCADPCGASNECPDSGSEYYHGFPCPCGGPATVTECMLAGGCGESEPFRGNGNNRHGNNRHRSKKVSSQKQIKKDQQVKGKDSKLSKQIPLAKPLPPIEATVTTQFQIINFLADDGLKTETRYSGTYIPLVEETKSKISKSELRGNKEIGSAGFEGHGSRAKTIRGTLTTTIRSDGLNANVPTITFVSGSNIRLDTNEASNIIRISVDDLTTTELLDVEDFDVSSTSYFKYNTSKTQFIISTDAIVGPTGPTGAVGEEYQGVSGGILYNIGGATASATGATAGATSDFTYIESYYSGETHYDLDVTSHISFNSGFTSGSNSDIHWIPARSSVELNDYEFNRPKFKDISEASSETYRAEAYEGIPVSLAIIDFSYGNIQYVEATAGAATTSVIFFNIPESGVAGTATLIVTNGGFWGATGPNLIDNGVWPGGKVPTLTENGIDILSFLTIDGGSTVYCFLNGTNMS